MKSDTPYSVGMQRSGLRVWLLAALVLTLACSKEDEAIEYFVDSSLQTYFDRFAAEGAERGVTIDFASRRINGYIRLITTPQVIGQCARQPDEPNSVIIDKLYWDAADDLDREFLVFHELGHCALDREHLDHTDNQGFCSSIMTSGSGLCQIRYTVTNREAMLDELFHP